MKVNLKKIGAIVAGAAILASSAAFAGLMYKSTTLVDQNGAPVAKVVIGSNAAASDGVAAALIAGKMVSAAYASQTLTASVSGTPTCSAGANITGGTCQVSNKTTTLDITVPGTVAQGTWVGGNLIDDWINRVLLDRDGNTSTSDNNNAYPLSAGETTPQSNPFATGNTATQLGSGQQVLYQVSGGMFSPLATTTVTDATSGNNYAETQNIWIKGSNYFQQSANDVIGQVDSLVYSVKFDGPGSLNNGIPVYTTAGGNSSVDYSQGISTDQTVRHQISVNFLGQPWIIAGMTAPTSPLAVSNQLVNGGQVQLAQETVNQILHQTDSITSQGLKFQLDDLVAISGDEAAVFSVFDANGNKIPGGDIKVVHDTTQSVQYQGHTYRIHVYDVAPGFTQTSKWANVAIYSQLLTLTDGQQLDQSGANANPGYTVALGWSNINAENISTDSSTLNPDALRTIVLYADNNIANVASSNSNQLLSGQYMSIVQNPAVWRLTYQGLNLPPASQSQLTFNIQSSTKTISATNGPTVSSVQRACEIFAPYVQVNSGTSGSVFTIASASNQGGAQLSANSFIVAINSGATNDINTADSTGVSGFNNRSALCSGTSDTSVNDLNYTQAGTPIALGPGTVFMTSSPNSNTGWGYATPTSTNGANVTTVQYQAIGDGSNTFAPGANGGGAIVIESGNVSKGDGAVGDVLSSFGFNCKAVGACASTTFNGQGSAGSAYLEPDLWFATSEKAGVGQSNGFVDYYMFGVNKVNSTSPSSATFQFTSNDGGGTGSNALTNNNNEILYGHPTQNTPIGQAYNTSVGPTGPVQSGIALQQTGYISGRGSKFTTLGITQVGFNMATALAQAQWQLSTPSSTSTSSSATTTVTLAVGAHATVGGVTVRVDSIDEIVGACAASGAAPSCTVNPVSAVIMGAGATPRASVTVATPYAYSNYANGLVILDSDAAGVNTLISVGGDKVNSVTASLLQGATLDWNANPQMVQEVVPGSKIVVAGKDATDTMAAARNFVTTLTQN